MEAFAWQARQQPTPTTEREHAGPTARLRRVYFPQLHRPIGGATEEAALSKWQQAQNLIVVAWQQTAKKRVSACMMIEPAREGTLGTPVDSPANTARHTPDLHSRMSRSEPAVATVVPSCRATMALTLPACRPHRIGLDRQRNPHQKNTSAVLGGTKGARRNTTTAEQMCKNRRWSIPWSSAGAPLR